MGAQQHAHRHGRLAAEFARQRPLGASAIGEDAAEDLGARGGARDLFHLLLRIDGEERNAQRMGPRDVAFLLDGVAEGDAIGGGAGIQRHLDLRHRGGVEARAEAGQQRQDLGRRIGLHRIEDAGVGHAAREEAIVLGDDFEIDHEAGAIGTSVTQEVEDASGGGHGAVSRKTG